MLSRIFEPARVGVVCSTLAAGIQRFVVVNTGAAADDDAVRYERAAQAARAGNGHVIGGRVDHILPT